MSRIYLIGAGPGDPELLTLKAVRALQEADVVLYDHLINEVILSHCKKNTKTIFVGKEKGNHIKSQDEINNLLIEMAQDHPVVARVKGGDPLIFGRGGEEYEYVTRHGHECEIIPGITAAMGAAASLPLPLTHRDYASEVTFITGHRQSGDDHSNFKGRKLKDRTHVIYMGVTAIKEITGALMENPENENIPVAVIERATRENQRIVTGNVSNISAIVERENIRPPAIMVVGRVIEFLEKMRQ